MVTKALSFFLPLPLHPFLSPSFSPTLTCSLPSLSCSLPPPAPSSSLLPSLSPLLPLLLLSLPHSLHPAPSSVTYKDALVIENPCDPNPCAEGYFCAINHKCQAREQGCTSFSCQPGCIIGDRPSFVVPEYSGVRVNLVTNSDRQCYGYFNCSTVRQGASERSGETPAAIGGTALPQGIQPINSHCENGSTCNVDGSTKCEFLGGYKNYVPHRCRISKSIGVL